MMEVLGGNGRDIWKLSYSNETRTHNYLIRKLIFNHLAELAKSAI